MKIITTLLTALSLSFAVTALADSKREVPVVSNADYNAAVKTGKPIFVAFNADWCPTCRKQNAALATVKDGFTDKAYIFSVDWDKKNDFAGPKTKQRSTIAYIIDGKMADQLIGETDAEKIKAFIQSKLN